MSGSVIALLQSVATLLLVGSTPIVMRPVRAPPVHWLPKTYKEHPENCARSLPVETSRIANLRVDDMGHGEKGKPDPAESAFGPSPLHVSGDAAAYIGWRCWSAANGDGTLVVAEATEIPGSVSVLGPEVHFPGREKCPKSSRVKKDIATGNGIRLGMTRAEVERLIGPALHAGHGWFERACESRRPMTAKDKPYYRAAPKDQYRDVLSSFVGVERDGRLIAFRVLWSETD